MDVGGWVAIGGLAFAILLQALIGAWHMGRQHQKQVDHSTRLDDLEENDQARTKGDLEIARLLAGIGATLTGMGREIGEIKADLHNLK
jgi:hypothetical protein